MINPLITVTSYRYDCNGKRIGVINEIGKALTYSYDPVGNRASLLDSDGGLTTYSYDPQNRLAGIVNPYNEFTTIQYDALDRENVKNLANGMTVNHTFDAAGRETIIGGWDYEYRLIGVSSPSGVETDSYSAVGMRKMKIDSTEPFTGVDFLY